MELNELKDITTSTLLRIVNERGVYLLWNEKRQRYEIQHYPHTGMETSIENHSQITLVEVNGEGGEGDKPHRMLFRIPNEKLQGDLPKTLATIEKVFPKETQEDIIEKVLESKGLKRPRKGIYITVENYPRQGIQTEFMNMTTQYQLRVREVDESPLTYPNTYSIPTENVPNHKFEGSIRAQLEAIEVMYGEWDEE